jgi:Ca2+-binding RTX toxin-like protein
MHKRLALILAVSVIATLALSAAAHAAPGTVTVYDGGDYKFIRYEAGADANVVTFGGDRAAHSVTITEAGIADPGSVADPGNICSLNAATLTCVDPKLGANGWYGGSGLAGQGADTVTVTGNQEWLVYGGEGADKLTGSDRWDDHIEGGPGNDVIDARGNSGLPYHQDRVTGDEGDDVVRGGAGDDDLDGGPGKDDVHGDSGDDYLGGGEDVDKLHGGAGDDYLDAGSGDGELSDGGEGSDFITCLGDAGETYDGGTGLDKVECLGGIETGPGAGPDDYVVDLTAGVVNRTNHVPTASALRSIEDAETIDGNDVLIGTDGANSLFAGRGNDTIDGRGGTDYIWGSAGNDTIETADGAPDRTDAGTGADACHADQLDELFECESLTLAPAPSGTAGDRTAPRCRLIGAFGTRARGLIDLRARCDEAATLGAEAVARLKRAPRGVIASRVGDVTLGTAVRKAAANKKVRLVVRISKRYRRALRKGGRIRIVLHATDARGNARAVSRAVRMR